MTVYCLLERVLHGIDCALKIMLKKMKKKIKITNGLKMRGDKQKKTYLPVDKEKHSSGDNSEENIARVTEW